MNLTMLNIVMHSRVGPHPLLVTKGNNDDYIKITYIPNTTLIVGEISIHEYIYIYTG